MRTYASVSGDNGMAYDLSFGQWLALRRNELRLQRTELAALVGCATVTLRKIESDERRPSQQLALLLAERLHLPPLHHAMFVRIARGELSADRLPTLLQPHAADSAPNTARHAITPVPTQTATRTNLPTPLTSFVGREEELDAILALIRAHRLVTLTGVGGVGKTRLALEIGIRLVKNGAADVARDGIWLVELAAMTQPTLVAQAIAQLFHIPEQHGREPLELLQEYLAEKNLLLILDNCEHLIDVCAELADYLLQRCWQLRVLATSRELLRVRGEVVTPVAPLPLPDVHEQRPEQILSSAAAQLFVERMHNHPAVHTSNLPNSTIIAQICRQLDGIPLALELAAPLAQSMSLSEIASQLQNQMSILTNTYRTVIPRHQTMHSALVWSYRLLAPDEQILLTNVAVFAGGWSLEAAQAICSTYPPERVRPMLHDLIVKSFVLPYEVHTQRRYRLLEPVRQFALVQLQERGMQEVVQRRHAEYFLALAQQMSSARDTPREREWLQRLEPERDNIHAVNSWAIAHGERELAHRLNGALFAFWLYCSSVSEANHWLDLALAIPVSPDGRAQTSSAREAEAVALNVAGYTAAFLNLDLARSRFEQELALRIEIGEPSRIAGALCGCSFVAMLSNDLDQAQQLSEQAMALSRSVDDQWGIAWALYDLGYIALVRNDLSMAQYLLLQAIPQLRVHSITFGLYRALTALGQVWQLTGENSQSRSSYHDALRLQQHMGYLHYVAENFEGLAAIAACEQSPAQTAIFLGAAEAHRRVIAMPRWQHQQPWYEQDIALAHRQLEPVEWERAWQQGYAMSLDQAVAYALRLPVQSLETHQLNEPRQ
jgi:predicted ATPase/DNA-binding XRE family transcriptional regulator